MPSGPGGCVSTPLWQRCQIFFFLICAMTWLKKKKKSWEDSHKGCSPLCEIFEALKILSSRHWGFINSWYVTQMGIVQHRLVAVPAFNYGLNMFLFGFTSTHMGCGRSSGPLLEDVSAGKHREVRNEGPVSVPDSSLVNFKNIMKRLPAETLEETKQKDSLTEWLTWIEI